jgi:hypothetical protein
VIPQKLQNNLQSQSEHNPLPAALLAAQRQRKHSRAIRPNTPTKLGNTKWRQNKNKPGAESMLALAPLTAAAHTVAYAQQHSTHPPHCCLGAAAASPLLLPTHNQVNDHISPPAHICRLRLAAAASIAVLGCSHATNTPPQQLLLRPRVESVPGSRRCCCSAVPCGCGHWQSDCTGLATVLCAELQNQGLKHC